MNHNKKDVESQIFLDVYVIWCRCTNQFYVGVTQQQVAKRIRQHRRGKQFVDKEIQRLGWENWDWWVVEENIPSNRITEREQYWVNFFGSVYPDGYNKTIGGIKYFRHSKKTCNKWVNHILAKKEHHLLKNTKQIFLKPEAVKKIQIMENLLGIAAFLALKKLKGKFVRN